MSEGVEDQLENYFESLETGQICRELAQLLEKTNATEITEIICILLPFSLKAHMKKIT